MSPEAKKTSALQGEARQTEVDSAVPPSPPRRVRLTVARAAGVGAVLVGALLLALLAPGWLSDQPLASVNADFPGGFAVPVDSSIPEFTGRFVQGSVEPYGEVFSNFDLYGRITVLLVWASWDSASVEWLDQLQLMRLTRYFDEPINWVGVAFHDQMAAAQQVVDQTRTTDWPHLWLSQEPRGAEVSLRKLGFSWVPGLYVFDAQGQLRFMGWSPTELPKIIDYLSE